MRLAMFIALAGCLVLGSALAQDAAKGRAAKAPAAAPQSVPVEPEGDKPEPQITVKGAKNEEETKARLRADALLARCIIKPVMTDDEIDLCKRAYRESR
jgi:hypothetical protein